MTEIILMKVPGGYLAPVNDQDKDILSRLKLGEGIKVKFSKVRSIQFHRRYFALMNYAFECWEPEVEYNGIPVEKNFERFRHDITIAAGYYTLTANIKGEARAEAKSISFSSMDEDEFCKVYRATVDVLIKYVLKTFSPEEVDNVVNGLLEFA